jgi:hypothetical protein
MFFIWNVVKNHIARPNAQKAPKAAQSIRFGLHIWPGEVGDQDPNHLSWLGWGALVVPCFLVQKT